MSIIKKMKSKYFLKIKQEMELNKEHSKRIVKDLLLMLLKYRLLTQDNINKLKKKKVCKPSFRHFYSLKRQI
jgi:hypothetical protein